MKVVIYFLVVGLLIIGCASSPKNNKAIKKELPEDAVVISNDSLEYEIIIYEEGYNYYLKSIAKPIWYFPLEFLENKNQYYVTEWNIRVNNPFRYNPLIYENIIYYDFNINYGLEVNYKLYNYFKFIEYKYKIVL